MRRRNFPRLSSETAMRNSTIDFCKFMVEYNLTLKCTKGAGFFHGRGRQYTAANRCDSVPHTLLGLLFVVGDGLPVGEQDKA